MTQAAARHNWPSRIVQSPEVLGLRRFLIRPTLDLAPPDRRFRSGATLFALSMGVTLFVAVPVILLAGAVYDPPTGPDDASSFLENLLLAAVAAPLLEEPVFRLWLSRRRALVVAGVVLLVLWTLLFLSPIDPLTLIAAGSGLVAIVAVTGSLIAGRRGSDALPERHLPVLVWGMAVVFGLQHITNFDAAEFDYGFWWLIPIIVSPQILSALVYSYVRVRLGFLAAIVIHGAENLCLSLLELFA